MVQYPDAGDLLRAVADFLATEVRPALAGAGDKALGFRALIASHVLQGLAAELELEDQLLADELASLASLGLAVAEPAAASAPVSAPAAASAPASAPASNRPARSRQIAALDAELSRRIRDRELDPAGYAAARGHLMRSIGARLAVHSPRFDRSLRIE